MLRACDPVCYLTPPLENPPKSSVEPNQASRANAPAQNNPPRVAMSGRTTRRQALEEREAAASLATTVMSCADICRLLLPALPFGAFVSLRCSCAGIYRATQAVCEELVAILERAALLYVSPRFSEALTLVSEHQPHLSWLIQTPALAVVTCNRYEEVIAGAYHLLQAHLTRMQKLAVSLVLRRAASLRRSGPLRRCMLLHLALTLTPNPHPNP